MLINDDSALENKADEIGASAASSDAAHFESTEKKAAITALQKQNEKEALPEAATAESTPGPAVSVTMPAGSLAREQTASIDMNRIPIDGIANVETASTNEGVQEIPGPEASPPGPLSNSEPQPLATIEQTLRIQSNALSPT